MRLDDWTNVTRSHTVEAPTNDPAVVAPVALDLLRAYDPPRPVRLLGVRVAGFESGEAATAEAEPRSATSCSSGSPPEPFTAASQEPSAVCEDCPRER